MMLDKTVNVVNLGELGKYLDDVVTKLYGASRLLLLPAILNTRVVNCNLLRKFCCDGSLLALNYKVGGVTVVRAELGSLSSGFVPCAVDARRMPPLRKFIDTGVLRIVNGSLIVDDWDDYLMLIDSTSTVKGILTVLQALSECRVYSVASLSRCLGLNPEDAFNLLFMVRMLYPAILELIMPNGSTINSILRRMDIGAVVKLSELAAKLPSSGIEEVIISPSELVNELNIALPRRRFKSRRRWLYGSSPLRTGVGLTRAGDGFVSVRSAITRYAIPSILDLVNFRGAVVADVGCGFGVKGAYGIRHGASFVVLIDIDEGVLRLRRSGLVVDLVVADARMLPLRKSSIDVVVLWNVINFIREKGSIINEVKRVCRNEVVFSVYNATNAYWRYTYEDFLSEVLMIGRPRVIKRVSRVQYQAIVRVSHDKRKD